MHKWLVLHVKGPYLLNIFEIEANSKEEALEKGSIWAHGVEVIVSYIEKPGSPNQQQQKESLQGRKTNLKKTIKGQKTKKQLAYETMQSWGPEDESDKS